MNFPLISVIIPTYNYAFTIVEAVKSVLNQSYPIDKIEIVVVDDGSTDNTKEALDAFISNNSIKYVYQTNSGKAAATAVGLQNSAGEIIFNLDADDIFLPNKISSTVNIYEQFSEVVHVSSPAVVQKKAGLSTNELVPQHLLNSINNGVDVLEYFYLNNILFGGGSTFSCRRIVFKNYDIPVDVDMYIDELMVILALSSGKTYFINEPLSVWNVHSSNYSIENNKRGIGKANTRLLTSSEQLLQYLVQNRFSTKLVKLFLLKHEIRKITYKENTSQKSIKDILGLLLFIIKQGPFSITVLGKYHFLNRLLPNQLLWMLKRFFGK